MEDFASAVLVAALRQVLVEDGLAPPLPPPTGALLPLEDKRRLVARVADEHGLLPMLRVGSVIPRMPANPVVSALQAAHDPLDLFVRWGRLETFSHSRHRVVVRVADPGCVVAEHLGAQGAPPHAAEDALVLGALTALLQGSGTQGLTVALDDGPVVFADGIFTAPSPGQDTARWRFTWASHEPPARRSGPEAGGDIVARTRALVLTDPARRWSIADAAAGAAMSVRTLQRHLRAAGGFAALVGAARADLAADLLVHSDHPFGAVGFACGYSDQPHFSREFKRRTAMTPAAYRSAFPGPPPSPRRTAGSFE